MDVGRREIAEAAVMMRVVVPHEQVVADRAGVDIQRKIERATREELAYDEGNSEVQLNAFFNLMMLTRRRHGIPPQSRDWFRNLIATCGKSVAIRVANRGTHPVASLLTLEHRNTLVYKYGCSDAEFHNLGAMAFLFWTTIQSAPERLLVAAGRILYPHMG